MITTHSLGFPRIGKQRELKFALEKYWNNHLSRQELQQTAASLRQQHWQHQAGLDLVPVGDFSLYDQVLDTSFMLGHLPARIKQIPAKEQGDELDNYFRLARGRAAADDKHAVQAGEMTKWFDTNYHYIVPEFEDTTTFSLNADNLLAQIAEARQSGIQTIKPIIIGPVTWLWLGKSRTNSHRLDLLDKLIPVYAQLLKVLKNAGIDWVQIDEPVLVMELSSQWQHAIRKTYYDLQRVPIKILLATYFGALQENLQLACDLPVDGLHIDAINGRDEVTQLVDWLPAHKVLSLGVINGRNIWKTDLQATLKWLKPIHQRLQERLWLAPSCSLLHVPVDLSSEKELDIYNWLAFATQKIEELVTLATALNHGNETVAKQLADNQAAIIHRQQSEWVHNRLVQQRLADVSDQQSHRQSDYATRSHLQRQQLNLPVYPTTTIGSFPQTQDIRQSRKNYRRGKISESQYHQAMKKEIKTCIRQQEILGLDVLVHGEPERNDMVEYFAEQLNGYTFSQFGWVQSYGSRCVKPPIIFGDISRSRSMTVD